MANIAFFDSKGFALSHIYQWDVDRIIEMRGVDVDITDTARVDVGLAGGLNAVEVIPLASGDNSIKITLPAFVVRAAQPIAIYLYQDMGNGEGRTVYEATLDVLKRNRPISYSDAEYERQMNEEERIANEAQRQANEADREEAEAERVRAELERQYAELARESNEAQRQANEAQRIINENERIANEARRAELEAQMRETLDSVEGAVDDATAAAEEAREAAQGVQDAINAANSAASDANAAAGSARASAVSAAVAASNANEAAQAAASSALGADLAAQSATAAASAATEAATSATTAATEATEAATAANEAAAGIDARFEALIDQTLTESGKAADAKIVGDRLAELESTTNLKLDAIVDEEWIVDQDVPTEDMTVHPGKTISGQHNMASNENYTCVSFVIPADGGYKITTSAISQLGFFLYDEATFTAAHFIREIDKADAQNGVFLNAGDALVVKVFGSSLTVVAQYATAPTVMLNQELELTATQDAQMQDYVKSELDDVLENGYQHLKGTWARGGWSSYNTNDSRAFRVRYTDIVEFDRDVWIVMRPGYYASAYFSDGTSAAATTVLLIKKGFKGHITVRRAVENYNEVADIAEFAAALSISTCIADIRRYDDTFADVSMFVRMGVCGDSYAGGGGIISGIRPLTWGKSLERQAGIVVDIYAKSGQTVVQWMTDATNGLPALLSKPECGLYWMQHGINGTGAPEELGTPEDMSADPRPQTFYGQYTEAVKQIQATYPNARIVLATIVGSSYALYSTIYKDVNIAIKSIAEYCEVPCIDVVDDDFYKSRWYADSSRSNHPTAMETGGMAAANRRLISRTIRSNPDYFVNYGSSGYSIKGAVPTDNNYTNADKAKVDAIPADPKYTDTVYDDTEVRELIAQKQNKLTAGTGITINDETNVISSTATGGATLATTVGNTITATFTDGDNGLRFDVAGDVIQMDFRNDDLQNTRFLATQGYVDAAMAAFEPYRVKQFTFTGEWNIPSCTADVANTSIPKFVMQLEGDEAENYAFVGMLSYEVFDAETGGNRVNYMPVCQFTGGGQTELSVRGCVMGSTSKIVKRVSCWTLLKHR